MDMGYSFLLTTFAGLSTLIGMVVILFKFKNVNKIIVSSLSFASSVMLSVSVLDLFKEAIKMFNTKYSLTISLIFFIILFFFGTILTKIINKIIPGNDNLYKLGIMSSITIILHNIPEGILTFLTSSVNKELGLSIAFAIAMHNIPEGISISVPIYYSSNSKKRAFFYTFISALSEPFGALIAYVFLTDFTNSIFIGTMLSLVFAIMINVSLFELFAEAKKYNEEKLLNLFFILGFIFMTINFLL